MQWRESEVGVWRDRGILETKHNQIRCVEYTTHTSCYLPNTINGFHFLWATLNELLNKENKYHHHKCYSCWERLRCRIQLCVKTENRQTGLFGHKGPWVRGGQCPHTGELPRCNACRGESREQPLPVGVRSQEAQGVPNSLRESKQEQERIQAEDQMATSARTAVWCEST